MLYYKYHRNRYRSKYYQYRQAGHEPYKEVYKERGNAVQCIGKAFAYPFAGAFCIRGAGYRVALVYANVYGGVGNKRIIAFQRAGKLLYLEHDLAYALLKRYNVGKIVCLHHYGPQPFKLILQYRKPCIHIKVLVGNIIGIIMNIVDLAKLLHAAHEIGSLLRRHSKRHGKAAPAVAIGFRL